jgi:hypothetical protein
VHQPAAAQLTWCARPCLLHLLLHDLPQLQQSAEVQLRVLAVKAALLAQQESLALQRAWHAQYGVTNELVLKTQKQSIGVLLLTSQWRAIYPATCRGNLQ